MSEEFTDANSDLLRLRSNDFCTDPAQKALSVVMNLAGLMSMELRIKAYS